MSTETPSSTPSVPPAADRSGRSLTATTRLAGVIGHPVRHSLSPAIHNAAYAATGLDWAYLAFDVAPERLASALDGALALGIQGLSVTMPHKEACVALVDQLTPAAERLGAVNCIKREGDHLIGGNNDGDALVAAIRADTGIELVGKNVVILGAGGAARSVIDAVSRSGADAVTIVNRTANKAVAAAERYGNGLAVAGTVDAVECADVVINATSVGMGDDPSSPVPAELLRSDMLVVDLIYAPRETRLLADAARVGAQTLNGVGMLVHLSAEVFEWFTGEPAPVEAMRAVTLS